MLPDNNKKIAVGYPQKNGSKTWQDIIIKIPFPYVNRANFRSLTLVEAG